MRGAKRVEHRVHQRLAGADALRRTQHIDPADLVARFELRLTRRTALRNADDANAGSIGLWAVALVAALVGVVMLVPKIRGKVVPGGAVEYKSRDLGVAFATPEIDLDERWRQSPTWTPKVVATAVALPLLRRYGYRL